MAATAAMIAQVSEYTVDDTGASLLTTAVFTYLSAVAKVELDLELGTSSLDSTIYDYCHALLIAHKYAVKRGQTGYTQQSAQGYSVARKVGETAYLVEYRATMAKYASSQLPDAGSSTAVLRSDADMTDFHLDGNAVPSYFTEG